MSEISGFVKLRSNDVKVAAMEAVRNHYRWLKCRFIKDYNDHRSEPPHSTVREWFKSLFSKDKAVQQHTVLTDENVILNVEFVDFRLKITWSIPQDAIENMKKWECYISSMWDSGPTYYSIYNWSFPYRDIDVEEKFYNRIARMADELDVYVGLEEFRFLSPFLPKKENSNA